MMWRGVIRRKEKTGYSHGDIPYCSGKTETHDAAKKRAEKIFSKRGYDSKFYTISVIPSGN